MPDRQLAFDPKSAVLSLEEVEHICRALAAWGVERLRLTGGEPTLRRGLVGLVERLSAIEVGGGPQRLEVTMTTNGERLEGMAADLAHAGLHGLTVSLDSIDGARFRKITRRGDLGRVRAGLRAAARAGLSPLKLNTVALRGFNDDELADIARFAWDHGAVPRFIELMPMAGGELFAPGELMPAAEIRDAIGAALGHLVPDDGEGVRGRGPATYWRVASGPYVGRRVGTIAAMTENFCESCNRVRLSTTGQLHGCLAHDDTGDLRGALRSGDPDRLLHVVGDVLGTKRDGHGFQLDGTGGPRKAMVSIGG